MVLLARPSPVPLCSYRAPVQDRAAPLSMQLPEKAVEYDPNVWTPAPCGIPDDAAGSWLWTSLAPTTAVI